MGLRFILNMRVSRTKRDIPFSDLVKMANLREMANARGALPHTCSMHQTSLPMSHNIAKWLDDSLFSKERGCNCKRKEKRWFFLVVFRDLHNIQPTWVLFVNRWFHDWRIMNLTWYLVPRNATKGLGNVMRIIGWWHVLS